MILLYVLCSLLFFNPIVSSNLKSYLTTSSVQMDKEAFEKFEVHEIFDECITDSGPIVTVGSLVTIQTPKQFFNLIAKPIYLLDYEKNETRNMEIKKIVFTPETYYSKSIKATKFIIEITSTQALKNRLIKLINSAFWNAYGYFLVINNINCQFVNSHLKIIWEFNILNVVYCCPDPTLGVYFYIFNPFNEEAPTNWKKVDTVYQKNKHPMRIFRNFANKGLQDSANCKAFLFEKVKNISGYPLKVVDLQKTYIKITDITGKVHKKNIFDLSQNIIRLIWTELGVIVSYEPINLAEIGALQSDGSATGVVSKIVDGVYECRGVMDLSRGFWRHEVNMFISNGICYTTKKDLIPITKQLVKAFPLRLSIMGLIFFGISTCVYVYSMKGDSAKITLDVLRAILGQGMICKPQNRLSSFIFSGIVISSMTVTMILQSLLNAVVIASLTVGKDIRDFNDVARYNFQVYADPYYNQYFVRTILENKIFPVTGLTQCLDLMQKNNHIACPNDCIITSYIVREDEEYLVSKDEMLSRYNVFFFRRDSPLKEKFQSMSLNLLQSGITQHMIDIEESQFKQLHIRVFAKITVYQLRSAFYFLLIFIIISFAILSAELLVHNINWK